MLPTDLYELQVRVGDPWVSRLRSAAAAGRRVAAARRPPGGDAAAASARAPAGPAEPGPLPGAARLRGGAAEPVDAAIAMSERVGEIYRTLGVDEETVRVVHLTVRHLETLRAKAIETPPAPVRFATLNGVASEEKGAEVVPGALEELVRGGMGAASS